MKKSTRVLFLLIFIETIIIGGGLLLLWLTKDAAPAAGYAPGETARRIFEMMGLFGGGVGGVLAVLYFVLRSKERRQG